MGTSVTIFIFLSLGAISAERKFRNAPIATSVKTGVNFDCPEEFGYYPHPSDCTQYYVCVFGGALLESCTGGLMYSHELQTCDWPRNVGCDGLEVSVSGSPASFSYSTPSRNKEKGREKDRVRDESRTKFSPPPPPPPPQPAAVVTSRGQPRNLHQSQQEIIKRKQQQQLYADAEETLPPAEEIENDRQQRVYRGQPSTIGQVQRDRDGLRHSNAISSYSGRGEKIGVISFGTQNQHYRSTDDDILLKHLTSKRRQKRQIRKSNGSMQNMPVSIVKQKFFSRRPETIHHPPRHGTAKKIVDFEPLTEHPYHSNTKRISFNPSAPINSNENEEEFHPFTPSYQKSSNYQYIAFGKYANEPRSSTSRYVEDYTNSRLNKRNRYPVKYKSTPVLILQSDYSQIESRKVPATPDQTLKYEKNNKITQAIVSPYTETTSTTKQLQNNLNESKNETTESSDSASLYEKELDHFKPPPEFFRSGNNYGHIKNPFSNPEFDFEEFLKRFEDYTTTTEKQKEVTTAMNLPLEISSTELSSGPNNHRATFLKAVTEDNINKDNKNHNHRESYASVDINNYIYKNLGNGSFLVIPKTEEQNNKCNTTNICKQEFQGTKNVSRLKPAVNIDQLNNNSDYYYYYDTYEDEPYSNKSNNKNNKDYIYYYEDEYYYPNFDLAKKVATKNDGINKNHTFDSERNGYVWSTTIPPPVIPDQQTEKTTIMQREKYSTTSKSSRNANRGSNRMIINRPTHINMTIKKQEEKLRLPQTTTKPYKIDSKKLQWKGTQSEEKTVAPQQASVSSITTPARNIYNGSQYNDNRYEPYYALYEDDVEIYRDEYPANENVYSNNNHHSSSTAYRGTSPINAVTSASIRNEIPRRGNTVYIENNINHQDIYQPSTAADYTENNKYDNQADDQSSYKQNNRQSYRGDRNELNDVEEVTTKRTTKRTTTTTTTRKPTSTTTIITTTQRTIPPKTSSQTQLSTRPDPTDQNHSFAESVLNTIPPNYQHTYDSYEPFHPSYLQVPDEMNNNQNVTFVILDSYQDQEHSPQYIIVRNNSDTDTVDLDSKPSSTTDSVVPTTNRPIKHYITKASIALTTSPATITTSTTKFTSEPYAEDLSRSSSLTQVIAPTTYSPFRFVLKAPISKPAVIETTPISNSWRPNDTQENSYPIVYENNKSNNFKAYKALKAVRKVLNPISLNHELSPPNEQEFSKETESGEQPVKLKYFVSDVRINNDKFIPTNTRFVSKKKSNYRTTSTSTETSSIVKNIDSKMNVKLKSSVEEDEEELSSIEDKDQFSDEELYSTDMYFDDKRITKTPRQDPFSKQEPKPFSKPIVTTTTKTNFLQNDSIPTRASRVNAAIKSLITIGETRGPNKNKEGVIFPSKNYSKKRTPSRGRGSVQYSGAGDQITNNEVIVTNNRGTPPTRSRPTLKPSTSIVSKVQEFVDVYRYPPRRPDPIYPQPQVDKTAAKCRKDVCLLPDCSCGGKEIPGDLPVEQLPQIVLMTFDDSVNDLNKGLYQDLFEKGRTNPNGCPIAATFYVSHEWTDYSQVQNLYSDGHELASHTVSHSFGEQFSQKKWTREVAGQREILAAYGGVHLEDVRGMRAPFLSVGGNKMFKMLYDSNFTYDSSMPIYENKPPSWPYTLDYKLFHDCMIPPCPTRSYPGVWEVPMVMWQDLNGGRCSMGDACSNPPDADGVYKMLLKNFMRHYTTNRAPFGLFYHAAWFTQPHHKEGFIKFIDSVLAKNDVWFLTNWQAIQWVRDPTPSSRLGSFQPFQCNYSDRPKRCNNPKVCNLWHKSGVRYMRTCQPCPDIYPWTGNTGIRSSKIDNDIGD